MSQTVEIAAAKVFLVDDDAAALKSLRWLLESARRSLCSKALSV